MKFLVDSMLPPRVSELLQDAGHDAVTPRDLGGHNLSDQQLIELAGQEGRVIVTENASDFAATASATVLLVRKAWWPVGSMAADMAAAMDRWAGEHPEPGRWAHWLWADLR